MTREGAIEKLTALLNTWEAYNDEETREAVEMAIEALSQPPSLYGYNIEALYFVAGLLIDRRITQDDLKRLFEDSKWFYAKLREQFAAEVRKTMVSMVTTIGKDEVSVKMGGEK